MLQLKLVINSFIRKIMTTDPSAYHVLLFICFYILYTDLWTLIITTISFKRCYNIHITVYFQKFILFNKIFHTRIRSLCVLMAHCFWTDLKHSFVNPIHHPISLQPSWVPKLTRIVVDLHIFRYFSVIIHEFSLFLCNLMKFPRNSSGKHSSCLIEWILCSSSTVLSSPSLLSSVKRLILICRFSFSGV